MTKKIETPICFFIIVNIYGGYSFSGLFEGEVGR
jgi:hypothetical protein